MQHPTWGGVSVATPGAEGTALLLAGQKLTARPPAGPHPGAMTTLKSITAHRIPGSARPRPCGSLAAPMPGETVLAPTSTPSRRGRTGRNSGVRGTRNPLLERPFTLTHIHEICTKFNEGYTLHRMVNYAYASGNRSVRSTQAYASEERTWRTRSKRDEVGE